MASQYVLLEQVERELRDELLRRREPAELLEPILEYWTSSGRMADVRRALDMERERGEHEWHGLLREALAQVRG